MAILIVSVLTALVGSPAALGFRLFSPSATDRMLTSRPGWEAPGGGAGTDFPFSLANGQQLLLRIGVTDVTITFNAADFANIGSATATETVAVIDRELRNAGVNARATVNDTQTAGGIGSVRIESPLGVQLRRSPPAADGSYWLGGNANGIRWNGTTGRWERNWGRLYFQGETEPSSRGSNISVINPTDRPPFVHWDHRNFLGFKVPFTVMDTATANPLDGLTPARATAAVRAAFDAYKAVEPAIIDFEYVPEARGTPTFFQKDDWNTVSWEDSSTVPELGDASGLTVLWLDLSADDGRIIEADIALNNSGDYRWTDSLIQDWSSVPTTSSIQGIATHEIGHFIGLGHAPGSNEDTSSAPTMSYSAGIWGFGGATDELSSLSQDDQDGVNFLYTPDLGDAPDDGANKYPSFTHGNAVLTGAGSALNAKSIRLPRLGAQHSYGYEPAGYAFEWLGPEIEALTDASECEAKTAAGDEHDDGVVITGTVAGENSVLDVVVTVTTEDSGTHTGARYLNAWFDWNRDAVWDENEHEIGRAAAAVAFNGGPGRRTEQRTFRLQPVVPRPYGPSQPVWVRFRLDYAEDVGQVDRIDPTLSFPYRVAQFGEVEDYNLYGSYHDWNITITQDSGGNQPGSPPTVESSNNGSTEQNNFTEGDTVYIYGNGYAAETTYTVSVVSNRSWSNGDPIPARVGGSRDKTRSDATGKVSGVVWQGAVLGSYDIVVDVNGNGIFDSGIDALDDFDVGPAGFIVTPVPAGSGVSSMLTIVIGLAITGLAGRRRRNSLGERYSKT
ncbi:MAG: GEVED domain-containing protein [Candidatus Aquicultorales bacterium]